MQNRYHRGDFLKIVLLLDSQFLENLEEVFHIQKTLPQQFYSFKGLTQLQSNDPLFVYSAHIRSVGDEDTIMVDTLNQKFIYPKNGHYKSKADIFLFSFQFFFNIYILSYFTAHATQLYTIAKVFFKHRKTFLYNLLVILTRKHVFKTLL